MLPTWRESLSSSTDQSRIFGRTASLILPRLYLSDFFTAQNETVLSSLGITHVISALECTPTLPDSIPKTHRLHLCIADSFKVDILPHFEATTEFIRRALDESQNNKVLVGHAPILCHLYVHTIMLLERALKDCSCNICRYIVSRESAAAHPSSAHTLSPPPRVA
jgi:hypothetical protein